jgi:hypothetical protein
MKVVREAITRGVTGGLTASLLYTLWSNHQRRAASLLYTLQSDRLRGRSDRQHFQQSYFEIDLVVDSFGGLTARCAEAPKDYFLRLGL